MADHHVRARQRLELGVDDRRHLPMAERGAGVGEVGERRDPQRLAEAVEALRGDPRELGLGLLVHPELDQQRDQPRPPRPVLVALAGEHPDDRRELGQPALLAHDAEHLDPVHAGGVAPGEQPAPLVRAPLARLGLLEAPVAERDRRAVVLGDVEHERLRRLLGASRAATATSRRADSRSPRATKAGTRQAIASARISVSPSSSARSRASVSHLEDLLERGRAARPVGAHQHRRQPRPVAELARHLDRRAADDRGAIVLAAEVERPREPAEQPDPQLRALLAECDRRLLEHLDRALVGDSRAPARLLVADRRPGEQRRVGELARDLGGGAEGAQRVAGVPRPVAGGAELEVDLGALGPGRRSAARAPCAAAPPPRRTPARRPPPARRARCTRPRVASPRSGRWRRSGRRGRRGPGPSGRRRPRAPRRPAGEARPGAGRSAGRRAPAAPARA